LSIDPGFSFHNKIHLFSKAHVFSLVFSSFWSFSDSRFLEYLLCLRLFELSSSKRLVLTDQASLFDRLIDFPHNIQPTNAQRVLLQSVHGQRFTVHVFSSFLNFRTTHNLLTYNVSSCSMHTPSLRQPSRRGH